VAAQVVLGTAALVLRTERSFDELKILTPMETVDETRIAQLFLDAARNARAKTDLLQQKLVAEENG
jgi:hypothetical protein